MGKTSGTAGPRREFLRIGLALLPATLAAQTAGGGRAMSDARAVAIPEVTDAQKQSALRADYDENVRDARALTALAKSIELELDNDGQNVLSLGMLKKLDDVDKITKRMRLRTRK